MQNIQRIRRKTQIVKYLFLLSGAIVLLLILISYLSKKPSIIIETSELNKVDKLPKDFSLSINNPVFEGLNKNNLPYKILAKTVTKENDNIYNLDSINADYKIAEGNLKILAETGTLDELTKNFILSKNVKIMFDELVLISDKIDFDLHDNSASSKHPVEVNFKNSTVKAREFNTSEEYNIIHFEGDVVSTLSPDDGQPKDDTKIKVTSDRLSVDNNDYLADFTETVTVFFDNMILKTDRLKIHYDKNNDKKSITKIEIPGKLKAIKSCNDEIVIADSGEYIVMNNELTLLGNVVMNRKENIVVTDKMVYVTKYKSHKQNNKTIIHEK